VSDLFGFYNSISRTILDCHAPFITRTISTSPKWLNHRVIMSRRNLRRKERLWRSSKHADHRRLYQRAKVEHHRIVNDEKKRCFRLAIEKCGSDSKLIWKNLNNIFGRNSPQVLPKVIQNSHLAQQFQDFFLEKVRSAQSSIPSVALPINHDTSLSNHCSQELCLSQFTPASQKEVASAIRSMNSGSCELDPIPTHVIKKCLKGFLPLLTILVNKIFRDGLSPQLKMSVIHPLYKKSKLDSELLSSYRPVANLPFLAKLVEKLIASRITKHLEMSNKMDVNQHAYKKMHSCETALLTLLNEAFQAIDKGLVLPLVLLDLTAAFDVVDHRLLLEKCLRANICDSAYNWLQSYLSDRTQCVSCYGIESSATVVSCGVPQGSILGPLLFVIFLSDISSVMSNHPVKYILYADDVQMFMSSPPLAVTEAINTMETCVAQLQIWLSSQKLILNPKKSEFIIFSSRHNVQYLTNLSIQIGGHRITSSDSVRDLGVFLDYQLTLSVHVDKIRRQSFMLLRLISKIRRFLSKNHCALLIDSLVLSRINFCASVFIGLPKHQFNRIQSIMTYAIRVIEQLKRRDSVAPALQARKWLTVESRAISRLLHLVFLALHHGSPSSLASCLRSLNSSYQLRSDDDNLLSVPRTRTKVGDRSFSVAGPKYFNLLPSEMRRIRTIGAFKSAVRNHFV